MTHIARVVAYTRQTGSREFTPAQRRRIRHKLGRRQARQRRASQAS